MRIALRVFANWIFRRTHYRGYRRCFQRINDDRRSRDFRAGIQYALAVLDLLPDD